MTVDEVVAYGLKTYPPGYFSNHQTYCHGQGRVVETLYKVARVVNPLEIFEIPHDPVAVPIEYHEERGWKWVIDDCRCTPMWQALRQADAARRAQKEVGP